jgi:DNA-binding SARP family transcriptional activator
VLEIRLLGAPALFRDGTPVPLTGRKTWGLLAYLLLEPRPPTRIDALSRLSPDADDPQAALRWLLHQVRRAIGPEASIDADGDRLTLRLGDDVRTDVGRLFAERVKPAGVIELASGELLEGMAFDDAPGFELWLTLQRSRVRSAVLETLWWAATQLASTRAADALMLVERGLAIDPYHELQHELLVELLVQSGDRAAAIAHVEATERRFRDELGIDLPAAIRRPLERRAARTPAVGATVGSARALLESARTQYAAAAYDTAIATARRAADTALELDDPQLELSALTLLASILIHARRGRDTEAIGLLTRSAQLAATIGDRPTLAEIQRELGYVLLVQGDYGSSEPLLRQALTLALEDGDAMRIGKARTFLGMCLADLGQHELAIPELREAVRRLDEVGDPAWIGYAQGTLARSVMDHGDLAGGRSIAAEAMSHARRGGLTVMLPWPLLVAAEGALRAGDDAMAADLFEEALAFGRELDDPCWEGLGLRGLGLLRAGAGDRPAAIDLLNQGLDACARYPDVYGWAKALILVDLVELEDGGDLVTLASATEAVTRSPLPPLAERLRPWLVQTRLPTVPA